MIETSHLTRHFGDLVAVEDLTLSVPQGEVFGLLGPNGAGKTTSVRMLTALIGPTSGEGVVAGHRIGAENEGIRSSIGILTETPGLYVKLNAVQNLSLFARLHEIKDEAGQIEKYLRLLDLWDRREEPVGGFSKGMRQKVAIARALLHEPKVVFLDEPTSALDPVSAKVVRDFIAEMKGQGRTIILCTHNLDEADRLCDRIGLFKRRLVKVDTPEELRRGLYGRAVIFKLASVTEGCVKAIEDLGVAEAVEVRGQSMKVLLESPEQSNPTIIRALMAAGGEVIFVEEEAHTLERVYFDLLKDEGEGEVAA